MVIVRIGIRWKFTFKFDDLDFADGVVLIILYQVADSRQNSKNG